MHKFLTLDEVKARVEQLYDLLEENKDEMQALVDSQSIKLKKHSIYLGLKYCVKSNPCFLCPHNFQWRYVREESNISPKDGERKGMKFNIIKLSSSNRITRSKLLKYKALHMTERFKELDDKKDAIMKRRTVLVNTIKELSQLLQGYELKLINLNKKEDGQVIYE